MKMMCITLLGLLFSLQLVAGTAPHDQIEMQVKRHKMARHVHDALLKPALPMDTPSAGTNSKAPVRVK